MRFKTLKYHYKANNDEIAMLKFLCRISKNLYNAALNMIKKYKRNSNDTVIKYLMSRGLTIPYRVYVNM